MPQKLTTIHLDKFRQPKQGLMPELLTGRVRVDAVDSAPLTD